MVRSNPADGPPLAHPNHQKHRRKLFSSLLNGGQSALHPRTVRSSFPNPTQKRCVSGAQSTFVRRYSTGRSAVHFFDNYTEPNLFWNPSQISPADGPVLKGGRSAVTVALHSNSTINFSVLMHLHVSSCIIYIKLYIAQNNVK